MFQLSKKVDYAIILLAHLGRRATPASAQEIAGLYQLPQPMVANILKQLSATKLIESKRGQTGGYTLTRAPEEITLAEIIELMDGEFTLVACVHGDENCKVSQCCPTQDPLQALHFKIQGFMKSVTLATIINPQSSTLLTG